VNPLKEPSVLIIDGGHYIGIFLNEVTEKYVKENLTQHRVFQKFKRMPVSGVYNALMLSFCFYECLYRAYCSIAVDMDDVCMADSLT
jgi:hypothetical protein